MRKMGWILCVVVMLVVSSPCQAQEWAYLYNPPSRSHHIQQTSTGDYFLFGGATIATIRPDGTVAGDAYVADAYNLVINSTEQTPEQGFVFAGHIRGYEVAPYGWHGFAVFKTNSDGTIAWANKYHHYEQGTDPYAYSIQNTPDGGYIVGGDKRDFSDDNRSCILKLNSAGLVVWYREMNDDTRRSSVRALRVTADNGYVVAGDFDVDDTPRTAWLAKLDASGNFEWEKVFDGAQFYSVEETSDGGYIAVGQGHYPNRGYRVLKVDSFGGLEWHKAYDTFYLYDGEWYWQRDGYATAIQETDDNGYVVVGYRGSNGENEVDVLMLKLDALGNVQWNRVLGGLYSDQAFCVRQTTDGGYLMAGQRATGPYPDYEYAAWLLKTDENGDIPTCGEMDITDVTVTSLFDEGVIATGTWSNTVPSRIEIDVTREADASVSRSNGCPTDSTTCECNLVPDNTTVSRGGSLGFQASVANDTGNPIKVLFGTTVTRPNGNETGFIWGPLLLGLTPYQTKSGHKTHTIPLTLPLGVYTYNGYTGGYGSIYDECHFEFEVVP